MAIQDVEALIKKAVSDDVFRISLSRDLEKTINNHNLQVSSDELDALKKIDWVQPLVSSKDGTTTQAAWVHVYKTST